jgi:hypothetical protein
MHPFRPAVLVATTLLLSSGCGGSPQEQDGTAKTATDAVTAGDPTPVPGQRTRADADGNGYPDSGRIVTGVYESLYAEDAQGDWWWDLGDGRVMGTVPSLEALDAATTTRCDYQISYRGDFGNTPLLDSGWMNNAIRCHGYTRSTSHYLIVHRTDPRYTGNPEWAVWGDWEYRVLTESGSGNLVRPFHPSRVAPPPLK